MLKILFRCISRGAAIICTLGIVTVAGCQSQIKSSPKADFIFKNAKIYTVNETKPWATSIAILDGKIVGFGDEKDISEWQGNRTRVVDLGGKLMLPSFGDAHVHPVYGGLAYARCSMHAANSTSAYIDIIKKCVTETDESRWVYGIGWQPGLFPPDGIPPKGILDEISLDRPLVFRSTGGHSLWVNSKALELAGITEETPDPVNGRIDRDPSTGELLGGLQEAAKDLVNPFLPAPTQQEIMKAISYTINHLNVLGITSLLDAGVEVGVDGISPTIEAYKALQAQGALKAEVEIAVKWDNEGGMEQIPALVSAAKSVTGPSLSSNTLKIWIDGVIAQRTAAMLEPYSDAHEEHGEPTMVPEALNEVVRRFDALGFQVMIHAIGDKAIRMSLDAFEQASQANGSEGKRHQITHTEFIRPEDVVRFGQLGVVSNFQPLWSTMDPYMQMTAVRVGPERMQHVYSANSILQAGGEIVYGSDWSVASADPFLGIEVALTRRTPGEPTAEPLLTDEAVTLEQAIEAYTLMVAKVTGREDVTGSITVGKSADLVIVNQDVFTTPVYDIGKTKVLLTMVAGSIVSGDLDEL